MADAAFFAERVNDEIVPERKLLTKSAPYADN